jgi:hypothetical protein
MSSSLAFIPASFDESPACHVCKCVVPVKRKHLIFIPLQLTSSPFMLPLVSFYASFDAGDERVGERVSWSAHPGTAHSCSSRIMIPSAAKWCVYLSSRTTPSGRRRAESSETRLLFLFYGRDSAVRLLLLSRQTAGQYWTLKSFMGGRVAASRRVERACRRIAFHLSGLPATGVKDIGRKRVYGSAALFANLSARDKTGWHELWIQQAAQLDHSLPDEQKSSKGVCIIAYFFLICMARSLMLSESKLISHKTYYISHQLLRKYSIASRCVNILSVAYTQHFS